MSNLNFIEKNQLEKLFQMGSGYVLNFSNRTFQEFVIDSVSKDIYAKEYSYGSGSKANQLREFWKAEPNHIVGQLISSMIDYVSAFDRDPTNAALTDDCRKIATRLLEGAPVPNIDAITPNTSGRTFESLAKSIRESIDNNEPEAGLDRLHTFVVKFIRELCQRHGISCDRNKPLHSYFGEYVKFLRDGGYLAADMTERILKSTISILESFNHVRNNQSLAHDNEILGYDESLLIFNNMCAIIRFLEAVEDQVERSTQQEEEPVNNGFNF